jgi:type 2A phosphatase activator TIP41
MPHSLFLLLRYFLRVDRVLFRIHDVRIFHEFGSNQVLREIRGREMTYDQVKMVMRAFPSSAIRSSRFNTQTQCLPSDRKDDLTPLTDPEWVARILGMLESDRPPNPPSPPSFIAPDNQRLSSQTRAPWISTPQLPNQRKSGQTVKVDWVSAPQNTATQSAADRGAAATSQTSASSSSSSRTPNNISSGSKLRQGRWKGLATKLEVAHLS